MSRYGLTTFINQMAGNTGWPSSKQEGCLTSDTVGSISVTSEVYGESDDMPEDEATVTQMCLPSN